MMAMAFIGIIIFCPDMNLPAFTGFKIVQGKVTSYLFPTLFVTIACGAVSGFHSLVSSGTASKQIKNEKAMLPVSFGAMLLESFLAVIALVCVGFAATKTGLPKGTPAQVFASSIATFLTKVGLPESISYTLITLAVSAFALLACAVFFKKTKRQGGMLWIPMFIMLAVTFSAIVIKIRELVLALSVKLDHGNVIQLVFAILLLILGIMVAVEGLKTLFSKKKEEAKA